MKPLVGPVVEVCGCLTASWNLILSCSQYAGVPFFHVVVVFVETNGLTTTWRLAPLPWAAHCPLLSQRIGWIAVQLNFKSPRLVRSPWPEIDVWCGWQWWEVLDLPVLFGGYFDVEVERQEGMWPPWDRPVRGECCGTSYCASGHNLSHCQRECYGPGLELQSGTWMEALCW